MLNGIQVFTQNVDMLMREVVASIKVVYVVAAV